MEQLLNAFESQDRWTGLIARFKKIVSDGLFVSTEVVTDWEV